jgi:hypothetical protein
VYFTGKRESPSSNLPASIIPGAIQPTKSQTVANQSVKVQRVDDVGVDESIRLAEHRALETIEDKAVNLAIDPDSGQPCALI